MYKSSALGYLKISLEMFAPVCHQCEMAATCLLLQDLTRGLVLAQLRS